LSLPPDLHTTLPSSLSSFPRRPPRSALFPYTTPLPISFPELNCEVGPCFANWHSTWVVLQPSKWSVQHTQLKLRLQKKRKNYSRSEEHTSELQSRFDLVCRLLLEKKKCTYRTPYRYGRR